MKLLSLRTRFLGTVGAVLMVWLSSTVFGQAPVYSFSTLAGANAYAESVDATGSEARFSIPAAGTVDGAGNLYVADAGNSTIRKVTPAGVVTTIAGTPRQAGYRDGPAASALFYAMSDIVADASGNLYVSDFAYYTIRKITASGVVSTFAGTPNQSGTVDGNGSSARFSDPRNMAISPAGDIYVSDCGANTIRKITPSGDVTTFAGRANQSGSTDGALNVARFNGPTGLVFDAAGNLYVSDCFNHTIRKITVAGLVTTLAGSPGIWGTTDGIGTAARFISVLQLTIDSSGNLYAADTDASTIRKISPTGSVTTLAGSPQTEGSADGLGSAARFKVPSGIAMRGSGPLYVIDTRNNTVRVVSLSGSVSTLAGTAGPVSFADGVGAAARFFYPYGVALDPSGNVYVADEGNKAIRKVTVQGVVTTVAGAPRVSTGLEGPTALTRLQNGDLLVTTMNGDGVQRVTPAGVVTTFAGGPGSVFPDIGSGNRMPFNAPQGIVSDAAGNVYIADTFNHIIRKITPAGVIINWAGAPLSSGSTDGPLLSARFFNPEGLAIDAGGNIYVADSGNNTIRKISPGGIVSTFAGSAGIGGHTDGYVLDARFYTPDAVAVDSTGNVFVSDSFNNTIRKITPDGMVSTIGGVHGQSGNTNGTGSNALFGRPMGIAVDSAGVLYVADILNHSIRKGTPQSAPPLPTITLRPEDQSVPAGSSVTLSVSASGSNLSYQWRHDGAAIPGAVQSSYTIAAVTAEQAGSYSVWVSNDGGTLFIFGGGARITVTPALAISRLVNISTRSFAGSASSTQIAGFIISGTANRKVLIRAGGPYLTQYGVDGVLADPVLTLYEGNVSIATNDDWGSDSINVAEASTKAGVVPLSAGSKDAALVATLRPGLPYTAQVTGKGNSTGVTIVEVYDVDDGSASSLSNISTRSFVGTGSNIQIAGFILHGTVPRKVLIRAGGPYLSQYGVDNVLADPVLTVFKGQTQMAQNDDWTTASAEVDSAQKSIGVVSFASGSKDAALVLTLDPELPYTVQVTGKNGSSGNALVEVYPLP